jgi:hypothetical protein
VLRKLKKINKCDAQYIKTCFIDSLVRVGAYLVYRKKRLTKTSKRGVGRRRNETIVFFICQTRDAKKTIDQVYKRRPKEYLGRERERERERERKTNN